MTTALLYLKINNKDHHHQIPNNISANKTNIQTYNTYNNIIACTIFIMMRVKCTISIHSESK